MASLKLRPMATLARSQPSGMRVERVAFLEDTWALSCAEARGQLQLWRLDRTDRPPIRSSAGFRVDALAPCPGTSSFLLGGDGPNLLLARPVADDGVSLSSLALSTLGVRRVRSLAALPDARALVGADDGRLLAIRFDSTSAQLEFEAPAEDEKSYICALAVDSEGSEVVSITGLRGEGITVLNSSWSGRVSRWQLPGLEPVSPGGPEYSAVGPCLALLPNGRVVVGFRDQTLLGFVRGERAWSFRFEGRDAAFAEPYSYLVSEDDRAAHGSPVRGVVVLPSGAIATIASPELHGEGDLRLWDASGHMLQRLFVGEGLRPRSIAVSPDQRHVLVGFEDGRVDLLAVERRP